MSLRLTLETKAEIEGNVRSDLFAKRRDALKDREHKIAEAVLMLALGDKERQFAISPQSWFPSSTSIRFAYGEDGGFGRVDFAESRRVPAFCQYSAAIRLPKSHPLVRRYLRLNDAKQKLDEDESNLRKELRKVLAACRTAKQFVEAWPNGAKYVPEEWLKASKALIPSAEKLDEVVSTLRKAA